MSDERKVKPSQSKIKREKKTNKSLSNSKLELQLNLSSSSLSLPSSKDSERKDKTPSVTKSSSLGSIKSETIEDGKIKGNVSNDLVLQFADILQGKSPNSSESRKSKKPPSEQYDESHAILMEDLRDVLRSVVRSHSSDKLSDPTAVPPSTPPPPPPSKVASLTDQKRVPSLSSTATTKPLTNPSDEQSQASKDHESQSSAEDDLSKLKLNKYRKIFQQLHENQRQREVGPLNDSSLESHSSSSLTGRSNLTVQVRIRRPFEERIDVSVFFALVFCLVAISLAFILWS